MIARNDPFEEACAQLFNAFFKKYPNDELRKRTAMALLDVIKRQKSFPGKHEGWAAGIMFAVCSRGCGVPDVMNSEVEEAFGVTMSTVRKRAWAVKRLLGLLPPGF
ncbi:MAG: DUF6398 domain-containing protein [Planctomycetota bacterium]